MVYLSLCVFLPLLCSIEGGTLQTIEALNETMRKVSRRETPPLPPPYLHLPVFVGSRLPLVEKERFTPTGGTGQESLPEPVRKILLPARHCTKPPGASGVSVNVSCRYTGLHVQVPTSILGTAEPEYHLHLGTCGASKSTRDYIYFEYDFGLCGTKRTIINNQVAYSNILHYDPPRVRGPIRRAVAFTLPVACYYNRYQYSYKIGYRPKMQTRRILKPMKQGAKFILTARNAQWQRLSPSYQYVLGKPMYFEAEAQSISKNERLWVELYGSESVCDCCDSSCSSTPPLVSKMITSRPWTIEPKVKPTTTPKREAVSTTKITTKRKSRTTTTSTPPPPTTQPHKTTRQVTKQTTTLRSEAMTVTPGKVEDPVRELEWVKVESEERQENRSAVVEEVTKPQRIFEDIFNFDK
ncbi:hypothetical protein PAMA_015498 [Pampus argenteus]